MSPPSDAPPPSDPVTLRRLDRPGDLGWVIGRHGELYHAEYGFDTNFEALVASVASGYTAGYRPGLEDAWIAEVDGQRAGSVFCCHREDGVAQLRLLLVEPFARGHGVGGRLVDRCLAFAVDAGYREMTLWTQSILVAARRLYAARHFELVDAVDNEAFGRQLVSETWQRRLDPPTRDDRR